MMRKKTAMILCAVLTLLTILSGCGRDKADAEGSPVPDGGIVERIDLSETQPAGGTQAGPAAQAEPAAQTAPAAQAEPAAQTAPSIQNEPGRQDGERFEDVIILEGMEETVRYEHVRNEKVGIEMDYDCESFVRQIGPDRERFVSAYDDPGAPGNYLEVTYSPEDAETAADTIGKALSDDYDISIESSYMLDHAGSCIRIDASNGRGNTGTPDLLQMVYIIPADDGCRVAAAHYGFESAEGFGRRFSYIVNTLMVIDRKP